MDDIRERKTIMTHPISVIQSDLIDSDTKLSTVILALKGDSNIIGDWNLHLNNTTVGALRHTVVDQLMHGRVS